MSVRSIRGRAVVAASLAILLAVVILGIGVDVVVGRHLHRSLDDSLRRRAVAIAQLSASAPALLTSPGALEAPLGGADASVEVLDRNGRLVARSLGLGGRVLPARDLAARVIGTGQPAYASATDGGARIRIYAAPLADIHGAAAGGAVVIAASTTDLEETIHALHVGVIVSALAAALAGGAAIALLLGRAFRPLGELAAAAGEIERTGDPGRRLPEIDVEDEIGRLATTLNGMLDSLERSREAERRFLADASHELRTPLTALQGNVAFLARHGATAAVVADLERDAARLARLADDLIAISREEAAARPTEEVDLGDLARWVAAHDRRTRAEADSVVVHGDRAALERALSNLVRNAQLHGPPGGLVTVSARRDGGTAVLSVADEGPGLDPDAAERAFERFWRGSHDDTGSGLGLAIVRATAERHGGRAFAEGSRFTIELPALREISEFDATPGLQLSQEGSP